MAVTISCLVAARPQFDARLLAICICRKDTSSVIRTLVELGIIKPTGDMLSVRRAISYFLENLARQTERQEAIGRIGEDLFAIALDQPFRFPATFTFVLRAFRWVCSIQLHIRQLLFCYLILRMWRTREQISTVTEVRTTGRVCICLHTTRQSITCLADCVCIT